MFGWIKMAAISISFLAVLIVIIVCTVKWFGIKVTKQEPIHCETGSYFLIPCCRLTEQCIGVISERSSSFSSSASVSASLSTSFLIRHLNAKPNCIQFFSVYSGAACKRRSSGHTVCSVDGLFISSRRNTGSHH